MSFLGGLGNILLGGALAVIGVATGNPTLVGAGAVKYWGGIGEIFSRGGAGPKPRVGLARRQRAVLAGNRTNPDSPIPLVYGEAKLGVIVNDYRLDTANKNDLYIPAVICLGSRDGLGIGDIEDIWFDDQLAYNSAGTVQDPFSTDTVNITKIYGTSAENWGTTDVDGSSLNDVDGSDWSAIVDKGGGLAGVLFKLSYDADVYANVPVITAKVKGNHVEDTRDEITGTISFNTSTEVINHADVSTGSWAADDRVEVTSGANEGIYTIDSVSGDDITVVENLPSTTSYSTTIKRWAHPDNGGDNPALCIRDYLLSDIYGPGLAEADIDEASFETMADYYDEDVLIDSDPPIGTQTRYTCNGWLDTSRPINAVLAELLSSCRGNLVLEGGTYRLFTNRSDEISGINVTFNHNDPGRDTVVLASGSFLAFGFQKADYVVVDGSSLNDGTHQIFEVTASTLSMVNAVEFVDEGPSAGITLTRKPHLVELTEDNIVGDWEFSEAGAESKINVVRATFIDADKSYAPVETQYPNPGESNTYLTADNSWENRLEFDLPLTNNVYMVEQISMIRLQESRWGISAAVTCMQEALQLQVGDIVPVTHSTPSWTDKKFLVMGMTLLPTAHVRLLLREYDPDQYSHGTHNATTTEPGTDFPDHKDFTQNFRCKVYNSTDHTYSGTPFTYDVTWNSEEYDIGNWHSVASNTHLLTVPGSVGGHFITTANITYSALSGGGVNWWVHVVLYSGTGNYRLHILDGNSPPDGTFTISLPLDMDTGDTMRLRVIVNTGVTITLDCSTADETSLAISEVHL
jgi:hypothetical protein